MSDLSTEIRGAVDEAQRIGPMHRNDEAKDFWADLYRSIIEEDRERHGLYGDLTGRAAAQQTRLQMIYACLDGTDVIGPEHVNAAAAVWEYCDASVQWIFADRSGDRIEDKLYEAILNAGHEGLSRKEQSGLFHRNIDAATLEAVRDRLIQAGSVFTKQYRNSEGGRPVTCEIATKYRETK